MMTKTGSEGRAWIDLEHPKPQPVPDRYEFWLKPPPNPSQACQYWARQIERGWLPNRRISSYGYDTSAQWYGVWIWEYLNVLYPMINRSRSSVARGE